MHFKRKVRAVDAALKHGKLLGSTWDDVSKDMLELTLNVSGERHDIVHGTRSRVSNGSPPRIRFLHQTLEPGEIKDRVALFTLEKKDSRS